MVQPQGFTPPVLRKKETGEAELVLRNVEVSGSSFDGVLWRKVRFVDCDFVGAYEVKADMETVAFERCRFAGIFTFGRLKDVEFLRCVAGASTVVVGGVESVGVRFTECTFVGVDADPNRWGGMGSYGETEFIRCKMKWTNVVSETKHTIVDCEFENVDCAVSKDGGGSHVVIGKSKLRGKFDMRPATLLSLTIRDTVLDNLDLSGATVKGNVLMERVKGGHIRMGVKEGAGDFSLKDSQLYSGSNKINETDYVYAGAFKSVLIENCTFSSGVLDRMIVAGGFDPDIKTPQPTLTQSYVIRKSKFPVLDASFLNAGQVTLQDNTIGSLNFSNSRIGALELTGNTIARSVDFSNTQVKDSKVQSLAKGQAKLDGSNVKVN